MAKINISIETVLRDALAETVKNISDQYQIEVENVSFDWVDMSGCGKRVFILEDVRVYYSSKNR